MSDFIAHISLFTTALLILTDTLPDTTTYLSWLGNGTTMHRLAQVSQLAIPRYSKLLIKSFKK